MLEFLVHGFDLILNLIRKNILKKILKKNEVIIIAALEELVQEIYDIIFHEYNY